MTHTEDADKRCCYCGLWDTNLQVLLEQGLPEGYCGHCEKCGAPGHTTGFPGPIAYTGSWCDKHFRRMQFYDPRTNTGCLIWLVIFGVLIFLQRFR
jgi:hypothetical protein